MSDLMIANPSTPRKTILICDRHPVTRRVLTEQLVASGSHLHVVSAVRDATAVVDAFTVHPVDVVLIGISGGVISQPGAVDSLLTAFRAAPVIVFGTAEDGPLMAESVARGAQGFMVWDISQPSGPLVVRRKPVVRAVPHHAPPPRALTTVEHSVLRGMSLGRTNHEISRKLTLSEQAVKTRCHSLFGKLGARDRAHAVALGLRGGLLG